MTTFCRVSPLLEAGYNKGLDLEKISGGGAEGFLKNASRQIAVEFSKETDMATLSDLAKKAGYADLGEAMGDKVNKLNRGTDAAAVMQAGQMHVLSVTPGRPGADVGGHRERTGRLRTDTFHHPVWTADRTTGER